MGFRDVFSTSAEQELTLPFMHAAQSKGFSPILRDRRFFAQNSCKILKGYYTFFFYGRAAYRPSVSKDKAGSTYELCVFVLHPQHFVADLVGRSVRLHPFDTGAFTAYDASLGLNLDLAAFELPQRIEVLNEVRCLYWPTDDSYCACDVTSLLSAPSRHHDDAIVSYHSLVRRLIGGDVDDRCATMEIAVEAPETVPFPLNRNSIKGLVIPHRYMDHPEVRGLIKDFPDIKIRSYTTYDYMRPSQRHSEIVRLVTDISK